MPLALVEAAGTHRQTLPYLKRGLKAGTLSLDDALDLERLQDHHVRKLVGYAEIGSGSRWQGHRSPHPATGAANRICEEAGVTHWTLVRDLDTYRRSCLLAAVQADRERAALLSARRARAAS